MQSVFGKATTTLLLLISPTIGAAQSVALQGLSGPAVTIAAAELKAMPHQSVVAEEHGRSTVVAGVPLTLLLAKVNAPQGKDLHGPAMTEAVVVTGSDGYRVVLALPDVDPAFRSEKVILADSADGRPLEAPAGPFRLVVEGDRRGARWVRGVVGLAVVALP